MTTNCLSDKIFIIKYRPFKDRKHIVHKTIIPIMRMLHSSLTANNQQQIVADSTMVQIIVK